MGTLIGRIKSQCLSYAPPEGVDAGVDAGSTYPGERRPFSTGEAFALVCNAADTRFINSLLRGSSPTAVISGVAKIVVDTIKTGSAWLLPHVGEKTLECHPLLANGYPSTAISVISSTFGMSSGYTRGLT